jgi:two-component system, cell cycle sensor histidine kinase and response regulator CckA
LSLSLDPSIQCVLADWGQMEQVVLNLVANARDAMPQGGRLTISTTATSIDVASVPEYPDMMAGRYVVVSVSDTGCGIDAATRPHIFEPFFTTKSLGEGTGLGLATVYGIVNQSDGYIAVESTPARGTVFHIYLPEAVLTADDQPSRAGGAAQPRTGTETILLAEDEETVRAIMRTALEQQGYTVLDAANGADAVQVFDQHAGSVDMLVTDIVMPRMSGRELHAELSSRRGLVKVLYLSGYADELVASQIATGPHVAFLQKPFTLESLTRTVREILDSETP